ncbi:hypothetical protein [Kitasatospora sp. NPDC059571]|uniref:hypothetical protein n=1 Tax=Kitasatospora sp. NPDC059571 TaxID=3346871 RepID=UPI0036CE7DEA
MDPLHPRNDPHLPPDAADPLDHSEPPGRTDPLGRSLPGAGGTAEVNGPAARVGLGLPLPDGVTDLSAAPPAAASAGAPAARDLPDVPVDPEPTGSAPDPSGHTSTVTASAARATRAARAAATAVTGALRRTATVAWRTARNGADAVRRTTRRSRAAGAARAYVPGGEPFAVDRPTRRGPVLAAVGATTALLLWVTVRSRGRHR